MASGLWSHELKTRANVQNSIGSHLRRMLSLLSWWLQTGRADGKFYSITDMSNLVTRQILNLSVLPL